MEQGQGRARRMRAMAQARRASCGDAPGGRLQGSGVGQTHRGAGQGRCCCSRDAAPGQGACREAWAAAALPGSAQAGGSGAGERQRGNRGTSS
jgi:hypothetical protein